MKNNKEIYVQLKKSERKFFKIYFDFLYNKLLTGEEKFIFIILKSFIDFSNDNNGIQGKVYPSIQTICEITGYGEKKINKILKGLQTKKVIKIVRRGLTKSNLYILSDYAAMWTCDNFEDLTTIVQNEGTKPLTPEEHIRALKKMGYKVEIKEKEPTSAPTKVTDVDLNKNISDMNKDNTKELKSQELERYTIDQIHQLFDYDIMLQENPYRKNDIDSAMSVLYTAMNTTKTTIKIFGEDKPTMIIISKLMKLDKESIMYALDKFSERTERIKNPTSYLLTVLYFAPEQFHLDIQNRVSHDMAHWNTEE